MTALASPQTGAVARAATAEFYDNAQGGIRLLLDSSQTGGALAAHWAELRDGVVGANPHVHHGSSELFYVLDGTVRMLSGDEVLTATTGDLIVVPPNVAHAFAAAPGCDAQLFIAVTPGIERFEFFRDVARVRRGELDPATFLASQEHYDTYPADTTVWSAR